MKNWTVPLLIILTRGKPEERVLDGCKQMHAPSGPGDAAPGCYESTCLNCSASSDT